MRYHDLVIEADDVRGANLSDGGRLVRFTVRVIDSPAGQMRPEEAVEVEFLEAEIQGAARALAARTLSAEQILAYGRKLGDLLLPPPPAAAAPAPRALFATALSQIPATDGLRLRLRLPPELASIPWEYAALEQSNGEATRSFLTLDPRLALVRQEPLAAAHPPPHPGGPIRLVAALASPAGLAKLDLALEADAIRQACANQAGIDLALLDDAGSEAVQQALAGAEVFHFAGHGLPQGGGAIALADGRYEAASLAQALQSNGVRLALLGGCQTGQRDGSTLWGGTAATLLQHAIPAVVAYQFTIRDGAAIAFTKQFYAALVGGLPIERAVVAGRIAAYELDPSGREWGCAVLYLRSDDGRLFAGSEDPQVREQAAKVVTANLDLRGSSFSGADVVVMKVARIKAENVILNLGVTAEQIGDNQSITGVEIDEI